MSDELRERVARACSFAVEMQHSTLDVVRTLGFSTIEAFVDKAWPNYLPQADAAIAIIRAETLEEAALVALDEYRKSSSGEEIATAIRALKDK